MNLWGSFIRWARRALHFKDHTLKGAPGVHDPAAAAAHVNQLVGVGLDVAEAAGPAVIENALHIHADQLKGAPGISDHQAAADHINALVQNNIEGQ